MHVVCQSDSYNTGIIVLGATTSNGTMIAPQLLILITNDDFWLFLVRRISTHASPAYGFFHLTA